MRRKKKKKILCREGGDVKERDVKTPRGQRDVKWSCQTTWAERQKGFLFLQVKSKEKRGKKKGEKDKGKQGDVK